MGFLGFSFCYAMAMLGYSAFLLRLVTVCALHSVSPVRYAYASRKLRRKRRRGIALSSF